MLAGHDPHKLLEPQHIDSCRRFKLQLGVYAGVLLLLMLPVAVLCIVSACASGSANVMLHSCAVWVELDEILSVLCDSAHCGSLQPCRCLLSSCDTAICAGFVV